MSLARAERVAAALLYEGYMLYPYRPSSVKNRHRFNFGVVYPAALSPSDESADGAVMQTECIVCGDTNTRVDVTLRFLHLVERTIADTDLRPVPRLEAEDKVFLPWQEAVEREVQLHGSTLRAFLAGLSTHFAFPATDSAQPIVDRSGRSVGAIMRRQQALVGELRCVATQCGDSAFSLAVRVDNHTPPRGGERPREELLLHSLVSVHTILAVAGTSGEFISLTDPPARLREVAAACRNVRMWPVLVGEPGERSTMLSSPIILADYPEIAPESAGDLFDGTEIDEILSLRILTLTDDEQREMSQADERARLLLERTQALAADQLMNMHGTMRSPHHSSVAESP